jgi:hypothetical protein
MQSPVKKRLKNFIVECANNSEYEQALKKLSSVVKTDDWKFVVQVLWSIKNEMAIELLQNRQHTAMSAEEKDITQKVYHNISEWIDFLTNPMWWVRKKGMVQILLNKARLSDVKGKDKSKPERKETR